MDTHDPVFQAYYALAAQKVVQNLKSRGFDAHYCATAEEAAQKALSLIPATDTVSWGGSVTLGQLGLFDKLKQAGLTVIDRDTAPNPEARADMMRAALSCGTFLTSVNALSEDGVLVNVDGVGNRVAAMAFGPRQVIVLAGMNKLCPTAEAAHLRARRYASPLNGVRLGLTGTPCAATGLCADCRSENCICSYVVETRMSKPRGRIKVILVGQALGY